MAKQKTAKEYLVRAKLYNFMSLLFVTMGVFVFCVMYVKNVDGQLIQALRDPMVITIFLVPFAPAAVFSLLADGAEKKYRKMVQQSKNQK